MAKVIRHQIADYLNTAPGGEAAYSLMGAGYTALRNREIQGRAVVDMAL